MSAPSTHAAQESSRLVVGEVADRSTSHRHATPSEDCCQSSWQGWWCTRPADHPGIHEAGTFVVQHARGRIAARWSR